MQGQMQQETKRSNSLSTLWRTNKLTFLHLSQSSSIFWRISVQDWKIGTTSWSYPRGCSLICKMWRMVESRLYLIYRSWLSSNIVRTPSRLSATLSPLYLRKMIWLTLMQRETKLSIYMLSIFQFTKLTEIPKDRLDLCLRLWVLVEITDRVVVAEEQQ